MAVKPGDGAEARFPRMVLAVDCMLLSIGVHSVDATDMQQVVSKIHAKGATLVSH